MPELPEVETIVRSLGPKLNGLEITSYKLLYPSLLRKSSRPLLEKLKGKKVLSISRRGKMILISCEGPITLLFHLKMTGQLLFTSSRETLDKHTRFVLSFRRQNHVLRFRDVRKFGFLLCLPTGDSSACEELRRLGPEPLEMRFPSFLKLFEGRRARLKSLLLNQTFIAGIGNIYADEILFKARLHPQTAASGLHRDDIKRLWKAVKSVLKKAIAFRGSSIRNFKDADGREGSFQIYHRVYGKESLPCPRCGERIRRIQLGGRSSYYCPRCQPRITARAQKLA